MTTKEIILKAVKDGKASEFEISMAPVVGTYVDSIEDLDKLDEVQLNNVLSYLRSLYRKPPF